MLANASEGVVAADLEGNVLHWNPAALAIHGFASLEECRRRLPEFTKIFELWTLDGNRVPLEQWPLSRVLRGEILQGWDLRVRRIGTDWQRVFSYGGTLARNADGEPFLAVISVADITERKRAEEGVRQLNAELEQRVVERTAQLETVNRELRHSRAELNSLFESLPGLYLVLTPDLKIVAASDAYLKATMTTREGILGRGLFEVFPDNPNDPGATGVSNLRVSLDRVRQHAAPDTMAIQKYDVRRPDGVFEERYWSPINSPLLGADNQIKYIIHRVEEVTEFVRQKSQPAANTAELHARLEQMEAEIFQSSQKIQATNRQLEAANQELEAFSYSVSHDLRAPLRSIDGFSEALREDYADQLDENGKDSLRRIRAATQRMGQLIDDLLNLSRVTRAELRRETVDLSRLAKTIGTELRQRDPQRHVEFIVPEGLVTSGDPQLLRVVLDNLLGNAWKFTSKQSQARIEFGSNATNGTQAFFVRDNGAGFDMAYASKLFGAFQRLHAMEEFAGTGIGLATVQRIINRHGGRVWAEAAVNQGATFYFTL